MDERVLPRLESEERLRRFGRGLAVVAALLALLSWRRHHPGRAEAELAIAIISALLAQARPAWIAPLERAWMPIALLLERINTAVLMGAAYYLIVTPIAVLQRLLGADPLGLRLRTADSYWKPKTRHDRQDPYAEQF